MSKHDELVKALRYCAESGDFNCNKDCPMYPNYPKCLTKMDMDAAAAIEDMSAQLAYKDYLIQQQMYEIQRLMADVKRQQEKMFELAKKLPKRGERTINPYESTWAIENGYI